MNSKEIAIKYLATKIDDPKIIFYDIEIFKSVLFWSREATREFFATKKNKIFLTHYIDDVGSIVDEYLISKNHKMYNDALKKKNKLFYNLYSSEKTIVWLIERWINVFVNLTSNPAYSEYIDISNMKIAFHDDIIYDNDIENILEFEKLQKLSKKRIIKALKKVWDDSKYDNFDFDDLNQLCEIFQLTKEEVILEKVDLEKIDLIKKPIRIKYYQGIINFN